MKKKKIITLSLIFTVLALFIAIFISRLDSVTAAEFNAPAFEGSTYKHGDTITYDEIISENPNRPTLDSNIVVNGVDYVSFIDEEFNGTVEVTSYDEKTGLYIPETGEITYKVNVEEEGYYNIKINYYSVSGRSSSITKGIKINGEYQFDEAESFTLSRIWVDEFDVSSVHTDGKHDPRPSSIEKERWSTETIQDLNGYYSSPFLFHFNSGENTVTFVGVSEPMVLGSFEIYQEKEALSYSSYNEMNVQNGLEKKSANEITLKVQGESSYEHNQATLNPVASYTSFKIEPYAKFFTRYNTIGGANWSVQGDWISWIVNVPEDGLYELTFKVLQNYNRGLDSCRALYINDEIPFEECKCISFKYSADWQNVTLGDSNGAYLFHFNKGENVIKLKNVIGSYKNAARVVNETISDLNWIYRKTIMRTGVTPSKYQDYQIYASVSGMKDTISKCIANLEYAIDEVIKIAGERSNFIASLDTTKSQLETFLESEKKLQIGLDSLETNITSLGTWIMSVSSQPLSIDLLMVHGENAKLPRAKVNFFEKIAHEFILLIGSYTNDTSLKSSVSVDGETITVWIMTGKDQANLVRGMIDESFTVQNGVNVELKLVSSAVLLKAILSGNGPDVAMGVGSNIPVNWGVRNAVVDLTQFEDFEEFSENFYDSAITPFSYNGSTYALPDTQEFQIQFVRKDIFNELGLIDSNGKTKAPETWDEVLDLLPTLQRQYLDYYLPNTRGALSPLLYSLIIQYGGSLYLNGGEETGLLEPEASEAFYQFVDFFQNYGFDVDASFTNRFRTGEMPIGVASYTLYNTLAVSAPEINGNWEFALLPGYKDEDGVIHQATASSSTGTIITESSKHKEAAWKYLKWWLGSEAQTEYAKGLESILGSAARYATANKNAFKNLPWSARDYKILEEQRSYSVGVPTVPGDYIVGRYIDNAFRNVLNEKTNPSDALFNYCIKINAELNRKQKELGFK